MKILCIGDSLGLPRRGCVYEDTWLALLRQHYPEHSFYDFFAGDRLIDSALHDFNQYYQYYKPDVVILQQGICDCAPRFIDESKLSTRIIRRLFYTLCLKNLYWRIVKSHKRNPNRVKTPPSKFVELYKQLINNVLENKGKFIVIIKIGHGAESVIASSQYFNYNVDRYNALIDGIASNYNQVFVVDPLSIVNEEMCVDGYHCGPIGMQKVSESLIAILDSMKIQ